MQVEKFMQKMSDGTEISVNRWIPEDGESIKAVVVFSHGMQEHALRYDRVGSEFAAKKPLIMRNQMEQECSEKSPTRTVLKK